MSDIPVDPEVLKQVRYEELQKIREKAKETEDQWQDDLSKWKSRRRTVNSTIVKKKEEREQVEQMSSRSDSPRRSRTYKEMQEEREENRGYASPTRDRRSLSSSRDVLSRPAAAPATHKLLERSQTVDSLYTSQSTASPVELPRSRTETPEPEHTPAPQPPSPSPTKPTAVRASPTSTGIEENNGVFKDQTDPTPKTWTSLDPTPVLTPTPILTPAPAPPRSTPAPASPRSTPAPASPRSTPAISSNISSTSISKTESWTAPATKAPETKFPFRRAGEDQGSRSQDKHRSMEVKPVVAPVSASLPRSYQRSDSLRLSTVIAPRPFGTQSTRIASLPRTFTTEESHKRFNGVPAPQKPAAPSRYSQFMTEEEARAQSSEEEEDDDDDDDEDEEEEEGEKEPKAAGTQAPVSGSDGLKPNPEPALNSVPKNDDTQEVFCDMRISLNQKPNSGRDFGFQTNWDSTGAFIKSIQEGSPAELCQLRSGDEVLTVSGIKVSEMNYEQWKASLDAALQQGCLVMDIRRHGRKSSPDKCINTCQESTEMAVKSPDSQGQLIDLGVASEGINGGFPDDTVTMRNEGSEPISLKNLKRRSEFFEQQGGAESGISDAPPVGSSPNRWSWDLDEERKRQEKWQKEQERLLQEKYRRDQEKLDEEWRLAQLEAMKPGSESPALETPDTRSLSPYSPRSPLSQATPPPGDDPSPQDKEEEEKRREEEELMERKRQEEAELLQREEEELLMREEEERLRRKREEEEEEERRLEAELRERKRREMEEQLQREEELQRQRKRKEEEERQRRAEEMRLQRKREEEQEERRRRQRAEEERRREQERLQEQWEKSKSTPELDEVHKDNGQVVNSGLGEASWSRDSQKRAGQPLSQAESERQLILQEMKKKTSLLTDSSWIRQRSPSLNKESANSTTPLRRGESLDNLDTDRPWRPPSWAAGPASYNRPQSAVSGSTPDRSYARPASSNLPASSLRQSWPQNLSQNPPAAPSPEPTSEPNSNSSLQRNRSVSGKKICNFCSSPLGKGAAMVIESLGLCYHLSCFKCIDCKSDLGGSQAGAEVRIRNQQLYCNSCYIRFKTAQPGPM